MIRNPRVRAALPLGALLLLATTGCGPGSAQALDVRRVDLDIALGKEPNLPPGSVVVVPQGEALPPGGVAVPVIIPVFPGLPVQPVIIPRPQSTPAAVAVVPSATPPPAPAPACANLDARTPSAHEATPEVADAATNGGYTYRSGGTRTVGSAHPQAYPTSIAHVISGAQSTGTGTFSFTDSWSIPGLAVGTTYASANQDANAAAGIGGQQLSQLGVARLSFTLPGGAIVAVAPPKPVTVLKTPATAGATFTDAGSDGVNSSSITVQGTIVGTVRVNACGAAVDAWRTTETITIVAATATGTTDPALLGRQTNLTLSVTRDYATGFGGQLVHEADSWSGTLNGDSVSDTHDQTVNSMVPTAPPAP